MAISAGGALNTVPNPVQATLASNYVDFTTAATEGWAQQYLPDLMEKEAEVFGNRTISGFLSQVGAEEAMTADRVVWSEQGRLHLAYTGTVTVATSVIAITGHAGTNATYGAGTHGLRVGDTVLVAASAGASVTIPCRVTAVSTDDVTCLPYTQGHITEFSVSNGAAVTVLKYGSEWAKGSDTPYTTANEPSFTSFVNKPVIIRDMFHVSGSDASAVGWVEVSGEDGTSGYLWYLKAEGETRMRFADNCEMMCLEGVEIANDTTLDTQTLGGALPQGGTQGLFDAISTRGNASSGITGVTGGGDLAEFDAILAEFDSQGAIEENMIFCNRSVSLAIDDMLAAMNGVGAGGSSYGVFENDEDMALNLGFSGFRRGSYDFYKSDWKYLNDAGTRGAINSRDTANAIRGVIVPAGVSSVYDQQLGRNMKRPFLHVRYRASQTDNRRFKTWVTGSVGAATSELDAMRVNYLSERCLITQGANNFMLLN
tara:strand:+ start:161 stop:1612 length:1452 start_codon:yes stop_codon:yes gene_type:complete